MGVYDAMLVLQKTLDLSGYGFPPAEIGIPVDARTGLHPRVYIDTPRLTFDSEFLGAGYSTETDSTVDVYLIMRTTDIAGTTQNLIEYMIKVLSPVIKALVESAVRRGDFVNDGARGSRVDVRSFDYDYRPKSDEIGAMRMTLRVSQFE